VYVRVTLKSGARETKWFLPEGGMNEVPNFKLWLRMVINQLLKPEINVEGKRTLCGVRVTPVIGGFFLSGA